MTMEPPMMTARWRRLLIYPRSRKREEGKKRMRILEVFCRFRRNVTHSLLLVAVGDDGHGAAILSYHDTVQSILNYVINI